MALLSTTINRGGSNMTYIQAITEVIGNLSTVALPVRDLANINRINRSLDILEAMKHALEESAKAQKNTEETSERNSESEG